MRRIDDRSRRRGGTLDFFAGTFLFGGEALPRHQSSRGDSGAFDGVPKLYGAEVFSPDLRGGAALVVAGLCAEGATTVNNIGYIDRGYEDFSDNLCALNADIRKV